MAYSTDRSSKRLPAVPFNRIASEIRQQTTCTPFQRATWTTASKATEAANNERSYIQGFLTVMKQPVAYVATATPTAITR
jgi:hypothetical protein